MARVIDRLVGHRERLQPLLDAVGCDRLAPTLLFAGPAGVGKKLAALALTQALVCERNKDGNACGDCGSCVRVETGQSENLMMVAPEGASIKIEQARDILQFLSLRTLGRARVVIIDQAHLMNPQSGNALLKALEEPPRGTHFILITHMPAAILATIRSRSQLARFGPLANDELKKVLKELMGKAPDKWVIDCAHGSVEQAQRMMESREDFVQLENATLDYLSQSFTSFPAEAIQSLKELSRDKTAQAYMSQLIQGIVRDAMKVSSGIGGETRWPEVAQAASALGPRKLGALAEAALAMENDLTRNVERGLVLENFAIHISQLGRV